MKAKALTRASRAVAREMRERHSPRLTNRDGACVDRAAADTYGNRDVVSGDPVRHLKIDLIETRETRSDAREDHAGRQTADCDGGRQWKPTGRCRADHVEQQTVSLVTETIPPLLVLAKFTPE